MSPTHWLGQHSVPRRASDGTAVSEWNCGCRVGIAEGNCVGDCGDDCDAALRSAVRMAMLIAHELGASWNKEQILDAFAVGCVEDDSHGITLQLFLSTGMPQ